MKIIDAGPLIAILGTLQKQGLFEVLIKLGYTLCIPKKVVDEITKEPTISNLKKLFDKEEIQKLPEISEEEFNSFKNRYFTLGKGEIEVILWGLRFQKEGKKYCCMLDDGNARKIAEKLELKMCGTIGLIEKLLETGKITSSIKDCCFDLLKNNGFRYKFK